MIEFRNKNGQAFLAAQHVLVVEHDAEDANTSRVLLSDGSIIEVNHSPEDLKTMVEAELSP